MIFSRDQITYVQYIQSDGYFEGWKGIYMYKSKNATNIQKQYNYGGISVPQFLFNIFIFISYFNFNFLFFQFYFNIFIFISYFNFNFLFFQFYFNIFIFISYFNFYFLFFQFYFNIFISYLNSNFLFWFFILVPS